MKNIEILVLLKEQVDTARFKTDNLSIRLDIDKVALDDLITAKDAEVSSLLETFGEINGLLYMLTEDLRESIETDIAEEIELEDFVCDDYSGWCNKVKYEPPALVELMDKFELANNSMKKFIRTAIKGYRILTQDGYGTQEG